MNVVKFFGPPGCGKTTNLLNIVDQYLADGGDPRRIGFLSFTKKATSEARTRAAERFSMDLQHFPYFRTLHSLAFHQIGLRPNQVMQWQHYQEIGNALGVEFQGRRSNIEDGSLYGMSTGDRMLFVEGLARITKRSLRATWESQDDDIEWLALDQFSRTLQRYKQNNGLLDYTDMLEQFCEDAANAPAFDLLLVDEMQDLSPLQFDCYRRLAARAKRIYVSADDDQCVHEWAGADVNEFLDLEGDVRVLDQSYRVPDNVHRLAGDIVHRISRRQEKNWHPKPGDPGNINWYAEADEVDLSQGDWMLLARNGYKVRELEEMCFDQGWSYTSVGSSPLDSPNLRAIMTWERLRKGGTARREEVEAVYKLTRAPWLTPGAMAALRRIPENQDLNIEALQHNCGLARANLPIWHEFMVKFPEREKRYFLAARRKGETLTKKPRINISTIHASKGGEAQNVMVLTDVSQKSFEQQTRNPDSEHRCFYVAVTRTMQNLHLIAPRNPELSYVI